MKTACLHIRLLLFIVFVAGFAAMCSANGQNKDKYWVRVEGGDFDMGCNQGSEDCYPDEQPLHTVSLSSFYIGRYEVTVKEYRQYCEKTGNAMPEEPSYGWHDDFPMVNVTWQQAADYAQWKGCRLPTEAEWEYAAKGGNKSKGYTYSGSNDYNQVAWSYENSDFQPHPVGQKQPNELGIYDMSGNAWEWCSDNYGVFYYASSPMANPKGPKEGLGKVNRGGCFSFDKTLLNVHHRRCTAEDAKGTGTGFRLVKDIKQK
ncbi:MAG: SUMF1/EgtB/PvdO family nonheme iron enzyme [Bacteroidales bacterium]|nr:SUMF1/EgtB/PvdO family nonheme iron enzyme [Bacteroidales bacterium]